MIITVVGRDVVKVWLCLRVVKRAAGEEETIKVERVIGRGSIQLKAVAIKQDISFYYRVSDAESWTLWHITLPAIRSVIIVLLSVFKEGTGMSFSDYVAQFRLQKAKDWLIHTEYDWEVGRGWRGS